MLGEKKKIARASPNAETVSFRAEINSFIHRMTLHVLSRFDTGLGCWAFGPADASAIPASWTTAETLSHLFLAKICHGTEPQLGTAFDFLDANFILTGPQTGGWTYHRHVSAVWAEPTAWAVRAYLAANRRTDLVDKGIAWLLSNQNLDGGFGSTTAQWSRVYPTAMAILALDDCLERELPGSSLQRSKVESGLSRALAWLIAVHTTRQFAWGTRAGADANSASTAHALLAISAVAPKFSTASRFLSVNGASILKGFRGLLSVAAWDRHAEAYLLLDVDRQILHRHFWTVNMVALVALFQLASFLDGLGEQMPLLLDLEASIVSRLRLAQNPPLHEATQAVWALSRVSSAIDSELMSPYYRLVAAAKPVDMGLSFYGSPRLIAFVAVLLYMISGVQTILAPQWAPVFFLVASIFSFLGIQSVDKPPAKLKPRTMTKTVHIGLMAIQAVILTYALRAVMLMVFPNGTLAIVVAITFTLNLWLGEYFKSLYKSIATPREKPSREEN